MTYPADIPLEAPLETEVQFPTGEWLRDEPPMVQAPQACKLVMTLLTAAP
ncbi:hypothetical protein [Leptolyngbya sp. PCC 6406]|nr:hypothetical protein [Leptolyngbya sp. PCC 6406]